MEQSKIDGLRHFRFVPEDIHKIFEEAAYSENNIKEIADSFEVDRSTVALILRRKTWTDVEIDQRTAKKAQEKLKSSPKRLKPGIADIIRARFAKESLTSKELAEELGLEKHIVDRVVSTKSRKDIKTTAHLQEKIDNKRKKNIGKTTRALNDNQIRQIRKLHSEGKNLTELGRMFGIHRVCIRNIIRGNTYKHVK